MGYGIGYYVQYFCIVYLRKLHVIIVYSGEHSGDPAHLFLTEMGPTIIVIDRKHFIKYWSIL